MSDTEWNSPAWCATCGDRLQSRFSGEFVQCRCGSSFVDQTPHYSRHGGSLVTEDPELDHDQIIKNLSREMNNYRDLTSELNYEIFELRRQLDET